MAIHHALRSFLSAIGPQASLLALDISKKRIGVATGSLAHNLASPLAIIERRKMAADLDQLRQFVQAHEATGLIIGLPLLASGEFSRQTQSVRDLADLISTSLDLPAWLQDESFTSDAAGQESFASQVRTSRQRKRSGGGQPVAKFNDDIAAAIIMQDFLTAARHNTNL